MRKKLTTKDVITIRQSTENRQVLADRYGVSKSYIYGIIRGERRPLVGGVIPPNERVDFRFRKENTNEQ